ncbi:retrovirus-related pol polyprotein from transposon TNT 1-94 [Tanacetum coccineum]|uniref:Retrovirus-related pol polyprotein from transposon TNT 1-94 n=1 Tax=Tanacetum coccineum TaxID=301880 RepID=A0ABQ4XWQ2_9ASTR
MFNESLNTPPYVDLQAPEVTAPIPEVVAPAHAVLTGSPSSITEDNHDIEVAHYWDMIRTLVFPIPKLLQYQSSSSESMQEELHEFERLEVWELVPPPDKAFVITLKWIYKVKLDELGGSVDPTLFIRREGKELLLVQIYVDDIIFAASTPELCDLFAKIMCSKFKMSMMVVLPMVEKSKLDERIRSESCRSSHYSCSAPTKKHLQWGVKRIFRSSKRDQYIGGSLVSVGFFHLLLNSICRCGSVGCQDTRSSTYLLSKVEGSWKGSAAIGDKEVTKQDLVLKDGDRGACKLLGDVNIRVILLIMKMSILLEPTSNKIMVDPHGFEGIYKDGHGEAPVAQQTIPQNSAFQTDDLDAYDSDCDDLSLAKAVMMANLSRCDPEVLSEVVQIVLWYLDSGCSKYMTGNRSKLMNFVSKFMGTVRFRNDQVAKIMWYGDYQQGNIIISGVCYVEGLRHNLFSVRQFCDADLEIAFQKNTCFIRNLEGVDLLSVSRDTNLYTISLDEMLKTSPICLLSKALKTKSWLWHRRLSHLKFGTLNKLAKDGLA